MVVLSEKEMDKLVHLWEFHMPYTKYVELYNHFPKET
jgi:hypothetical protein